MKKTLYFLCFTILTLTAIFLAGCDIETQAHKHSFTQKIAEEKYLYSTATCMEKAKYYYSCECGEKGTVTFEYGEKTNHSFTNYVLNDEQDGTKTARCDYAGCDATDTITEKDSRIESTLQFKTLSLNEDKVYGNVENSIETFDFASEVQALGSLTYFISSDSEGIQKIDTQTVSLIEGENKFYITELLDGVKKSVYEVTIYRKHIYFVSFKNGDTIVESRQIEENAVITEPTSGLEKTAYTFTGWDYDFTKPITKEITINACWEAVEYSIEYNADDGEMQESVNTYTIESETFALPSPSKPGYTFKYWTNENGDATDVISKGSYGNITLTANWTIDVYLSNDGTTVKGLSYDGIKDLVVLSEYNGIKVTNIESSAFIGFDTLNSITLSEGIVNIGENAFKYCSGIKTITIPASVTAVGNSAFKDCENLESVIWNARYCKSVGSSNAPIFEGCNKLTSVTIGEDVKKLPSYMFCGCNTLKNINIPKSVTSIEDAAFYNFSSLESITIPENITSIGNLAFYGCTGLTKVILNAEYFENAGSVSSPIFSGCTNLTNVEIGKAVKFIPSNIFASCVNLTSVSIAEGVEKIGSFAFSECTGLTEITIPQSLMTIEESAFSGCENLTNIVIPNGVTSIANSTFYNCSKLTSVTMPEYVSTIGSSAFYNCSSLTDISIKSYITSIGEYAFANCTNLKNVEICGQTTTLGSYLFNNCTKLIKVIMPKNVNEIGENAFNNCSSLVNLTMPDTVAYIGIHAFYNCSSLTEIKVPNGVKSIGKGAFEGCRGLTKVTLPQSLTDLGKRVFFGCTSLTGIIIPDGITKINDDSFSGCTSLSSIQLNKNITTIGENAFKDCNLTYTTDGYANYLGCDGNDYFFLINSIKTDTYHEQINANTKIICDYAFYLCSTIKEVTIPDSVTHIGNYAFCYCRNLTSVRKSTTSNVLEIGEHAFDSCSSLGGIQILDSVHTIKKAAFFGCAFTKLTIPKSVRIIEERAFENCESLEELIIKNGTTNIGDYAFYNCEKIYDISIPKSVKCIGSYAFAEVGYGFYYIFYEGTCSEFSENITLGEGWKDAEGVIMGSDNSTSVGGREIYPTNPDEWFN